MLRQTDIKKEKQLQKINYKQSKTAFSEHNNMLPKKSLNNSNWSDSCCFDVIIAVFLRNINKSSSL